MPLAYSSDLAWRVIWRIWGSGHWAEDLPRWLANQIADPVWGLAVSFHYVRTVWARYLLADGGRVDLPRAASRPGSQPDL